MTSRSCAIIGFSRAVDELSPPWKYVKKRGLFIGFELSQRFRGKRSNVTIAAV